jgi:C4-dicarboxylate-specific signal transduction histidine kinase
MTSGSHEQQQASATTIGDWATLSDELLQGLVHALNNRVAALSAFVELARFGDEEANPMIVLPAEIVQLHRVNSLFALLPERGSEPEALELPLVLDDALRLHEYHPRLRSDRAVVVHEGTPLPVRAPRWALLRVLVMLVHAAKRSAESAQDRGGATIRVVGDSVTVSVHVTTRGEPSPYLLSTARRCGGWCGREGDEVVLRMPSILELRRQERASQEDRG